MGLGLGLVSGQRPSDELKQPQSVQPVVGAVDTKSAAWPSQVLPDDYMVVPHERSLHKAFESGNTIAGTRMNSVG